MSRKLSDCRLCVRARGHASVKVITGWKINGKNGRQRERERERKRRRRDGGAARNDSRFTCLIFFRPAVPDFRERTEISRLSLVPRSPCQTARSRFSTAGSIYKCRTDKRARRTTLLGKRQLSSAVQCNAPSTIKFCNLIVSLVEPWNKLQEPLPSKSSPISACAEIYRVH